MASTSSLRVPTARACFANTFPNLCQAQPPPRSSAAAQLLSSQDGTFTFWSVAVKVPGSEELPLLKHMTWVWHELKLVALNGHSWLGLSKTMLHSKYVWQRLKTHRETWLCEMQMWWNNYRPGLTQRVLRLSRLSIIQKWQWLKRKTAAHPRSGERIATNTTVLGYSSLDEYSSEDKLNKGRFYTDLNL